MPPVARCAEDDDVAFTQSVRLLATEIVCHQLVVNGRLSRLGNRNPPPRLADMIAAAEKTIDSSNNPQTEPHK